MRFYRPLLAKRPRTPKPTATPNAKRDTPRPQTESIGVLPFLGMVFGAYWASKLLVFAFTDSYHRDIRGDDYKQYTSIDY